MKGFNMSNFRVIFTTLEEYDIEASNETEALILAEKLLLNDRSKAVVLVGYDNVDIMNLDEEND